MKVVATAPMPGRRRPSLPVAGLTSTPFLSAMCRDSGVPGECPDLPREPGRAQAMSGRGAAADERVDDGEPEIPDADHRRQREGDPRRLGQAGHTPNQRVDTAPGMD